MHVDVHAHHLPLAYMAALKQGEGPALGAPHNDDTLKKMVDAQVASGIDLQVLSTGPNSPYLVDPSLGADAAKMVNDRYHEISSGFDGRFAAFGALPLPHGDLAVAEAVRCLDELGLAGIHMGCSARGRPLDDAAFDDLWAELDRREAIVYVHPGGIAVGSEPGMPGMSDSVIAVTIGSAAEIATAALRLTRLCRKYRRVRPIIGLLGGSLPFLLSRVGMAVGKWPLPSFLDGLKSADELVAELRRFHYEVNLLPDPTAIQCAVRAFGADRLLFGSDSPSGSPASAIGFMELGGLAESERNRILGDNARLLFGERLDARHARHARPSSALQ